eukprot:9528864-Karenia_brevis.AAC.1
MPTAADYDVCKYISVGPSISTCVDKFLVLSLFDGIGGALQAISLIGLAPVGIIICECDSKCRRAV